MSKLKILFTMTPAFNPNDGGVQRTTYKLGKKFTELGHEVSYFSLSDEGNLQAEYGIVYHASRSGHARNQENLDRLIKVLDITQPDFVINQMPYETNLTRTLFNEKKRVGYMLLGCLRNSLFSVKNNVRATSKEVLSKNVFRLFDNKIGLKILLYLHRLKHRSQLKTILDLHDKFILLTPPNRDELKYFVGNYELDKVEVIPNSIPKIYEKNHKKENIILYVGRLNTQQKRADLLLKFWKTTYESLQGWRFVVVGDGPYKEQMENQIKNENIPGVELLGYQKPEEWYIKSPIFVMTSAYEGFPNVVLESQSYGCVPVAFNSYDALPWIVNHEQDAILVEPFDVRKMAAEVISLADNTKLNNMAEASKSNASKFVIDSVAIDWLNLFNKMTQQ